LEPGAGYEEAKKKFSEQILKRLQDNPSDPAYVLNSEQLDDIITCTASVYIRDQYSLKFQYTDLIKASNFISFESGIMCFFPNKEGDIALGIKDYCKGDEFYKKRYPRSAKADAKAFDHRCR